MGPTRIKVRVRDGNIRILFGPASKRTIRGATDIYRGPLAQADKAQIRQAAEAVMRPSGTSGG